MRYVLIPQPIILKVAGQSDQEMPFHKLLGEWLMHAKFGASGTAIRISAKIEAAFANCKVGDYAEIEDTDYQLLAIVVEECVYTNPANARQLIPFLDAVAEAKKTKPERLDVG